MIKKLVELLSRESQKFTDKFMAFLGKLLTVKTELTPIQDLEKTGSNSWLSLSDDPHFLVKMKKLRPGWYLVILNLQTTQHQNGKFYLIPELKVEANQETIKEVDLVIRPQRDTIRTFYVAENTAYLRFDPMENEGEFTINEFTLIKVPEFYAIHRQLLRISNLHIEFQDSSYQKTFKLIKKLSTEKNQSFKAELKSFYAETFPKLTYDAESNVLNHNNFLTLLSVIYLIY